MCMNFKQAIIVRKDIGMGKGKIAAQCAHVAIEAFEKAIEKKANWVNEWKKTGMEKIVLRVESKAELFSYYKKAKGLPRALIRDAGRTQIKKGTPTCIAIGPAPEKEIDKITSKLKLL